jgi:deoxyribodipyrimidine photolyase-related protein
MSIRSESGEIGAKPGPLRHLVLLLGDQLDRQSNALADFDPARDRIWMAEVAEEATHVWSHKARIALFLAAMRRLAAELRGHGWPVDYRELDEHATSSLAASLGEDLARLRPQRVVLVRPGDFRVRASLQQVCEEAGVEWAEREDGHFYLAPQEFARWARGRKELRLEHLYRWLRRRFDVLMDGGQPVGGAWNFDTQNRSAFDARGPGLLPAPRRFLPDAGTQAVLELVERRFADHPGSLAEFDWPLDPAQAEAALQDFIAHRLPLFGRYQDALWEGEPWLYHSRLSAAMNLKLISPRRVVDAAVQAWRDGHAPLAAVEGFVRQVLGWREYVRGLYWLRMPGYLSENALGAEQPLPRFYWTGETEMRCLRDALGQTLRFGYAHHIQRLMVTGLFALLLGVRPQQVHAWYLAVYVDAVEWVELPNVLGMSQYADGGVMASKPYVASGRYLQRMGNHCAHCPYRPDQAVGEQACPFTTLYWDFLERHAGRFASHPRSALQWKNLERLDPQQRAAIGQQAAAIRQRLGES